MGLRKIIRLFNKGNCCVFGLRGTGKDILFGNVIARRKEQYISNLDYGNQYNRFVFDLVDLKNTYKNFLTGNVNQYVWDFPPNTDIYLSDCGVYFPSQYNGELNKQYPSVPNYQALSRQVCKNNFHFNAQNLNRVWDKIREQSDIYIMCRSCKVIFGICFLRYRLYEKYQSAVDRVAPCRIRVPLFANKEVKLNARMYVDKFVNQYGIIKSGFAIFKNKSKHNTYYFGDLLKEGK